MALEQGRKHLWSYFISLLGRGLLCSRPFPKLPSPSGLPCMIFTNMIGQSQLRGGMQSALIILSCLFASRVPAHVPSGRASSIAIGWVFVWLQYVVQKAVFSTRFRAIWYVVSRCFCALLCLAPLGTPGVVGDVLILPFMSQLV
jgi:hypothetical protein